MTSVFQEEEETCPLWQAFPSEDQVSSDTGHLTLRPGSEDGRPHACNSAPASSVIFTVETLLLKLLFFCRASQCL